MSLEIIIPIILIGIGVFLTFFLMHRNRLKRIQRLRKEWGKTPQRKTDLKDVKILYELNNTKPNNKCYCVDDNTWQDLDLDEVFKIINRTTTPGGSQYLYYLMHYPVFDAEILSGREKLIELFSSNRDLREKVQLAFHNLNVNNAVYIPFSLWKSLPEKPFYARFLPFISYLSILVLILFILQLLHYTVIIGLFAINVFIRIYVKRKIDVHIYSFQYLGVLLNTAKKISRLKFHELDDILGALKKNVKVTKKIANKIFTLHFKDDTGILEYVHTYFLWDIASFYSVLDLIEKYKIELIEIFETVGYLDSIISIGSFRKDINHFCHPSFNGNNKYTVDNIINPLLTEPVPNSFEFDSHNYIVSGSNMSGKTTFLKTLGVNAVLSQTINTCMAEKYEVPFIKVVTSIGREDNLIMGKSYYLAEVESILRLLKESKTDYTHLFILDEIFRGTNSVERLAASLEVLNYLANNKDFILVATHDLQLCELLQEKYNNIHFREKISNDGLSFDYKLHRGVSTTRNAIALLKHVGYPDIIVENAKNRIKDN